MDKYNINRNREPLTPEDVQKGKDFDAFMKAYSAKPKSFWGSKTMYMSLATVGLIAVVGTVVVMNNNSEPTENPNTAFVQAPLAGLDVKDTAYVLDAANGADFIYKTGSFIHVPQNAFLDSAGNTVNGKVEIKYREFHNPAEIFLAGIPMTYDSAGTQYHFESAGMLEITAWQNGKPLKVNPSSQINIAMASNTDEQKYNVYYLDTVKKNWSFIAKDKAVVTAFVPDSTAPKVASVNGTAEIIPPVKPSLSNKDKPSFVISFEPIEFPELSVYKGVRFEVDENKTPYNKADKKVNWEDVNIERNSDRLTYTITFHKGAQSSRYVTGIVVDAANYDAAMKTYNAKYDEYQNALKTKQDNELDAMNQHEARVMTADARRIFINDSVLARALAARNTGARSPKEDMVMREFMVRDFGIWNSDCPGSLPQGPELFATFIDSKTKKMLNISHVFLVEKGKNALFTFYARDFQRFKFNRDAENLAWAVTPDGKLAVLDSDAFLDVKSTDKKYKFEMEVASSSILTGEQALSMMGY